MRVDVDAQGHVQIHFFYNCTSFGHDLTSKESWEGKAWKHGGSNTLRQRRRVSLGTPTSPSPDLAASLAGGPFRTRSDFPLLMINATAVETTVAEANTNGSSTWAVSGRWFGCFFLKLSLGPLLDHCCQAKPMQMIFRFGCNFCMKLSSLAKQRSSGALPMFRNDAKVNQVCFLA